MSRYVRIENGAVAEYPYSPDKLRRDNSHICFPETLSNQRLAEYGVMPVALTDPPVVPLNKNLVENDPALVQGTWTQQWGLIDASAEEIARRNELAAQEQEFDAAKLDAWILAYLDMTPTQAQTFINNNSGTLAELRTNVARLAYAVRVLIRREFNR